MRKRRTRQHIIEALGFNYLERQVLLAGYAFQKFTPDYGYDGGIHTYDENGEYENGIIHVQIKSTDLVRFSEKQNGFAFDLSRRDLELWLFNPLPVLIVLYDAKADAAFFIHLQRHFREKKLTLKNGDKFKRVFIPLENEVNPAALHALRKVKNEP